MRRFIPRFTLRRLLVVVLLVAMYFGAWELTKKAAASHRDASPPGGGRYCEVTAPLPFVLRKLEDTIEDTIGEPSVHEIRYVVWMFGYEVVVVREMLQDETPAPIDVLVMGFAVVVGFFALCVVLRI